MKRKLVFVVAAILLVAMLTCVFAACGKKTEEEVVGYNDGTYTGRSQNFEGDDAGVGSGYGIVTLKIEGGEVTECEFLMYELDGTLKDEHYGEDLTDENRRKAQYAVQSATKYAKLFLRNGSLSKVSAISGATISYNEFVQAVEDALNKAKKTN
ncbi:MAG: FMN-binding protein [Clostridia bacterium]|nr:FMN-binding protein [Clostridia bacterium]